MNTVNTTKNALLATALVATTALSAVAQDGAFIEEITVTAQKRVESIQTVPISIVAISAAQLERAAVSDILGIAARTPTLQFSQAGGEAQIYIRGVGSNLLAVGADPSVAINLDGVYLGRPSMGMNQFLDVKSVEVLRGPQGTLYGRNATGGAINITSQMPSDEFNGYVTAGTGSHNKFELKGAVGGPINDKFAYRIAARHVQDDGYVKNLDPTGSKLDDQNLDAGRIALRFKPNDAIRATAIMDWSDFDNGNTAVRPIDTLGAARLAGAKPTANILQQYNNLPTFMRWKTGGPTLNIEADLTDSVTFTSISSYKKFDMDFYFNTDGTEIGVTRTTETFDTKQFSQELRLASSGNAPLQWIAGAYYLNENKKGALGLVRENLRNAVTGAASPLGVFAIPATNDTKAYAVFGQVDYSFTDALKATAGIRYSDERKKDFNKQVNVFAGGAVTAPQVLQGLFGGLDFNTFPAALTRTDANSWNAWTPKFGLEFQAAENVMMYASATRGFKSGGYNDYQPTNPSFNPEYIWSYEAGVKSDLNDKKLRVNASAFYYDYKNLQVTSFLNSLTLVANAAQAKVRGLDLEVVAQPEKPITLGASASILKATYSNFNAPYGVCSPLVLADPTCAGRTAGQVRLVNATGKRLNNAPKFKGNAFAEYRADMASSGTLTFFGQVSYTDRIFFNAANDLNASQKSYTLLDGRVSWAPESDAFEISLFGKNLGNKKYFHNIVQFTSASLTPPATALPGVGVPVTDPFSIGNALGYPAPGRQWGIEAKYKF